ncbi:MAG: glycosyltransferase family 4 protein [Candidatus Gastranaerophilales bacterium]|nr:glycosyltransferase family 4 protein [Candidatus Gastranaerophilales bacterium]
MSNKKTKVLYDATYLRFGMNSDAMRTGLFFVVANILDVFVLKKDVQLTLFCEDFCYGGVRKYLKLNYPNIKFDLISDKILGPMTKIYEKLKKSRAKAKNKSKKIKKNFLQLLMVLFSPFAYLERIVLKAKYSKYAAFLSPLYKVHDFINEINIKNRYIVVHDLMPKIFPEFYPGIKYEDHWYNQLFNSLNSKDNYFSNSEYTRQDFLKHCPQIDPNKIHTTLLACADNFKPVEGNIDNIKTKYNIPLDKKYIFSLCTLEPRKNLIRSVKTFVEFIKKHNIDDLVFVLGGGQWDNFIGQLEKEVIDLGDFKSKIIKAGYVDDEDLAPLYSNAQWFVYTSRYEGFGLPPLEAMSCGCPVITSNNSSLPEVVGNSGIMIDWDSDIQHIEAYENYYFSEQLRKENSKKGLERAKEFSWEKCVDTMINIMRGNNEGK